MKERRSDFDITNTINVTDPRAVCDEVCRLLQEAYPGIELAAVKQAFVDFERLYSGNFEGYGACETPYHDRMHALDVALCTARLVCGFDLSHEEDDRIGSFGAVLGVVTALLHDSGYIRKTGDHGYRSGAEMTKIHVTRSGEFLAHYLPTLGLGHAVEACQLMLHFTGYEVPVAEIRLDDTKLRKLGKIIGTSDLLAQMSDRCYLEKCRDRLYAEFVASGLASKDAPSGGFASAEELLRKTPGFFKYVVVNRLHKDFMEMHRYLEKFFGADADPYMEGVERNIAHISRVTEMNDFSLLRRHSPWTLNADIPPLDISLYQQ